MKKHKSKKTRPDIGIKQTDMIIPFINQFEKSYSLLIYK